MAQAIARNSDQQASYTYEPLASDRSIRTLKLLPGAPSEPLRGSLRNHADEKAVYEALSYVWGDSTLSHAIELDGKLLPITANLHSALKRLRLPNQFRILWADGICINQTDDDEKSKQVNMMGVFYQYAVNVVIYLGEEADGSETIPTILRGITMGMIGPGAWNALGRLFLRPWWSRYWIIQEVVTAPMAEVRCGDWSFDFDDFAEFMRAVETVPKYSVDEGGTNANLDAIKFGERNFVNLAVMRSTSERRQLSTVWMQADGTAQNKTLNKHVPSWSLVDLLERCRSARATDERDYVYAVTGMCIERENGKLDGILPSYTDDTETVFIRYARRIVEWGDGLKLLYSACDGGARNGLPSWVPNWAARDVQWQPLSPRSDGARNYYYKAASSMKPEMKLSTLDDHLVVRGIPVGTIAGVGAVAPGVTLTTEQSVFQRDSDVVHAAATDLMRFARKHSIQQEAVWRTLRCNVDILSGQEASEAAGDDFMAFWRFRPLWDSLQSGQSAGDIGVESVEEFSQLMQQTKAFLMQTAPMCLRRRVAVTEEGALAQVPPDVQVGDLIFIPLGSAVPVVVRPDLDGYLLKGECYVHGVMGGELLGKGNVAVEDYTLI